MPIGNYYGDMDALVENGIYRVSENENLPTQVYYSQAIVCRGKNSDTVVQIVIDYDGATMVFRGASNTSGQWDWVDWQQVAIATPPQEFDLPLADGYTPQYTHSCIYYKTQETIVGVNVALIGEIPANSDVIIGTLPVGFRPKATCRGVAGSHFSPYGVGSVSIDGNGNINVRFTAAQVRCNFTICFLAAD